MKQKLLFFSFLLNLILLIVLGYIFYAKGGIGILGRKLGVSVLNHESGYGPYYDQRESLFNVLRCDTGDILFIGHSLIDGCEWSELFNDPKIRNRGINGEVTKGVLKQIAIFTSPPPRKIFLMTGTNDIGKVNNADEILSDYEAILKMFADKCPAAEVYLLSLLPVNRDIDEKTAGIASDFNAGLQVLSKKFGYIYIDLVTPFEDKEHFLSETYSNDGWHLMGDGYLKMKEVLEPYVKQQE